MLCYLGQFETVLLPGFVLRAAPTLWLALQSHCAATHMLMHIAHGCDGILTQRNHCPFCNWRQGYWALTQRSVH